ncbi:MAG TPA: hypothetical protein VFS25_01665, partial [Chitinophaga sp.]|uniref:hypothetical protein n=1 Tax=Chitinophaga sp. TaxID=1869181 RepID=UPI002DB76CF3
ADCNKFFADNEQAIYTRMEFNELYKCLEIAADILAVGYGEYSIPRQYFTLYNIAGKDQQDYPEMVAEMGKLKNAITDFSFEETRKQAIDACLQIGASLEDQFKNNKSRRKRIQDFYFWNIAACYLIGGNSEKSLQYYKSYYMLNKMAEETLPVGMFPRYYIPLSLLTVLHNSATTIDLTGLGSPLEAARKAVAVDEEARVEKLQQQEEDQLKALQSLNIRNEDGFIVTNEGDTLKGKISISYVKEDKTQIEQLGLGKTVIIRPGRDGKSYETFKPGSAQFFITGNRRFEPVFIKPEA